MPQRFRYNARTGELSGITSLKVGDPQLTVEQYVTNYIRDSAREVVYDSDLVISTMRKGLGSVAFDSDQIVAIIDENTGVGLSGFDSDEVNEIIREYLEDVIDDTGFDSDQVVAIINENVNQGFDSDQVVAIIDENVPVAGFDSDQINTIISEYSGFMPELQVNPGDDSDVIAAVVNIVNTQIYTDSDRDLVSNLRSDLDSESIEVRALRADFDSDSNILKTLNSQESVSSLRSDLDSETARIQLLFSNADSDQINIAILRRDADSDSIAIQDAKTRAENDAALIGLLRAELDSETSRIEELQDNLDSESSVISSIRSDLDSESSEIRIIRSDLDSDSIKIQQNDSDIKNLYSRIEAVEADSTFSGLTARLDSDENQLQFLSTRIDTVTSVNSTQNANIQKLFDNADSETSRIQTMLLRIDSDEQQLQTINERINSVITLLDSESIEIRALRADLDSESSIISQIRVDIDSDSTKIQDIQTQLDSESAERKSQDTNINNLELEFAILRSDVDSDLNAFDIQANASFDSDQVVAIINENSQGLTDSDLKSIADLRNDVDSDSTRIQSLTIRVEDLEAGADSDRTAIAQLRRDADSDSITIQSIRGAVDSDYALFNNKIELFNGLTDSDLTTVSNLRNDLDSESAAISKLRADVDSDFANRSSGFDSDGIVNIINENTTGLADASALPLGYAVDSDWGEVERQMVPMTQDTFVTRSIDDLNEAMLNVLRGTAVSNLSFTGDNLSGGAGFTTTLTLSVFGTPNRYDIYWGDGTVDSDQTDSTPSHTYSSNTGSPFTVRVDARNNSADLNSAGSFSTSTRQDYVTVYTATPVPAFAAYAAASGGSPITFWDDGDTVYFQNNTTNTIGSEVTYTWEWGDGSASEVVTDSDAGGANGSRIAHTFTASTEEEQRRTVRLIIDEHNTADPAVIPDSDNNAFNIFDTHTPEVSLDDSDGVNEESTNGHVVTVTNNTESTIGSYSTYGIQYRYTWGDGDTTTVNTGSGSAGDTGTSNLTHTYTLSSSDQANGVSQDYTGYLEVLSNHTSSPFQSSSFVVHVEPDVRANMAGTAITTSNASGDNQYTIYNHTDLSGNNRALVRMTNTTQNGDDYEYEWGDGDSDSMTEVSAAAGSTQATIDHDYTGESTGNYNVQFTARGTPDVTSQTDVDTGITFNLKAVPSAPAGLSSKSITWSTSSVGTSPLLASGFTDNTSDNTLVAGTAMTSSTARRYTGTGNITSSTVNDSFNGAAGNLRVLVDGDSDGEKTFTTTTGETGTFDSLVVSQQVDYNNINSSYPSDFYQVFDARMTKSLSGEATGLHDARLDHSTTGATNRIYYLKDDMTSSPSFGAVGSLSVGTTGTYRYISGIPYFNTGSPTITLSGATINNLVGQTYTNQTNIVEIDSGSNAEGTSSSAFSNRDYTYTNIDGSSTMLSSGVPLANTGTSSAYGIGDLSIPITTSSIRTVDTARIRARNVNGISSYSNITGNIQVHTASQSGISELAIAVSDSLGSSYTNDAVRVLNYVADSDNPPIDSSVNHYTNNIYSESTQASDIDSEGQEAILRLGVMKHDTTDFSSGYLPSGPDRSGLTGTQYYTFAFQRAQVSSFNLNITSTSGVAGVWIAAPGTAIDSASGLNGWLNCGAQYAGAGVPGSDTGNGGNGSDGCASTGGDVIGSGSLSGSYTMTLGTVSSSNATNNIILVRIGLDSSDSVTAVSIT